MFCRQCGAANPDDANFCVSCRFPLGANANAVPAAPDQIAYAGFWERFAALIIDNLLLYALTIPVLLVIGMIAGIFGPGNPAMLDALQVAMLLLPLLLSAAYFIVMESAERGATLGKRLLKLRVVDLNGNRIGRARALGRWAGHALSGIPLYLGYLIQPLTARKQALHDMISGTAVVKTEKDSNTNAIVIAVVALFCFFMLIVVILAAVSIPPYLEYGIRAKTAAAVQVGRQATTAVEAYYLETGRYPASLAETGLKVELPSFVSGVEFHPATAEIKVTFKNDLPDALASHSIILARTPDASGLDSWKCSSAEIPVKLLPASCR